MATRTRRPLRRVRRRRRVSPLAPLAEAQGADIPPFAAFGQRTRHPSQPGAGEANFEDRKLGTYSATVYGPPWGGINGGGTTAGGTDLSDSPRKYLVAIPQDGSSGLSLGDRIYVWPNPHRYRGTFLVDDHFGTGTSGKRLDIYDWRGPRAHRRWGIRDVEVIRSVPGDNLFEQIAGGAGDAAGAAADALTAPLEPLESIARFFVGLGELLLTPAGWRRMGAVLLGTLFVWWGISRLLKAGYGADVGRGIRRAAGTVALGSRSGAVRVAGGAAAA